MKPIANITSNKFDITNEILGSGAFSLVKVAYTKGNKTPIALKIYHCNSESEWLQSLNEICLLKKFIHPNVAKINNYEITRFHVLIGLDKGDSTLKEFISIRSEYELKTNSIPIMGQIINGLNYIHSFNIVHCDIKPNNILYIFKQQIQIKILDFGLSHVVGRPEGSAIGGHVGGTETYLSPERLAHLPYDETSDLFSAGIVFFEILFKEHPFYTKGDNYADIMKKKPDPKFRQGYQSKVPKEWLVLLCSMLSYNPKIRNEVRNNDLLHTTFVENSAVDHQFAAVQNVSRAEEAERSENYPDAVLFFMQACIDFGIVARETDNRNDDFISDLNTRILAYKQKTVSLIHRYKHSYSRNEATSSANVHDEYYDYLMQVTASTPRLKHYLEIGYNGEMYFRECKSDLALTNFMDALKYLNNVMAAEPPGDRKTIIGKKMLQWTNIAEALR